VVNALLKRYTVLQLGSYWIAFPVGEKKDILLRGNNIFKEVLVFKVLFFKISLST
jgi:hypothetical protein